MRFVKSQHPVAAALPAVPALIAAALPRDLNVTDPTSVKAVAKTIAAEAMSYYPGNETTFVDLPAPYYWWQCGAFFGSMLDYQYITEDKTYEKTIHTALVAQRGPNNDFMLPTHFGQEGNDDQAMWGFSIMAAAERNFPQPDESIPSWLQLSENIWNSLVSRWNTTACNGGLLWQIFASNPNGLDYKNSVSNGGLFQLSARLARATGNQTYAEWAEKVWDWTQAIGMIDANYNVQDGAHSRHNCTDINPISFSYTASIYMYGAAVMSDVTGDQKWTERTEKILEAAKSFFGPFENATNIMYEHACEHVGTCNTDMRSFKAYFSRFTYYSTWFVPSIIPTVETFFHASAEAAAKTCTGGAAGTSCSHRWYTGSFDGQTGLGEQMSALETIQGVIIDQTAPPLKGNQIQVVRQFSNAPAGPATPADDASSGAAAPAKRRALRRSKV